MTDEKTPQEKEDWETWKVFVKNEQEALWAAMLPHIKSMRAAYKKLYGETKMPDEKKTKPATPDQHSEAYDRIFGTPGQVRTVTDMRDIVGSIIGHPVDEDGVKVVGNDTTFISAAPDEDGAHITLTIRF